MKLLLKLEQLALFVAALVLFLHSGYTAYWFFGLLLLPDLSMLGYLKSPKIGALVYNLFHHQALAILLIGIGWFSQTVWIYLSGCVLLGHSSLDRAIGYGLKYTDQFQHTHLGWIGKTNKPDPNKNTIK